MLFHFSLQVDHARSWHFQPASTDIKSKLWLVLNQNAFFKWLTLHNNYYELSAILISLRKFETMIARNLTSIGCQLKSNMWTLLLLRSSPLTSKIYKGLWNLGIEIVKCWLNRSYWEGEPVSKINQQSCLEIGIQ